MVTQDRPVSGRQWLVLVLVLAALVIDGVDTQLLSLVAPLVMGELEVDKASLGPAMSGLVGGSAVLLLLPVLGWRGCFVLCGIVTLALVAAILVLLPESPAYLAARGRAAQAARLVRRVTGAEPQAAILPRLATRES